MTRAEAVAEARRRWKECGDVAEMYGYVVVGAHVGTRRTFMSFGCATSYEAAFTMASERIGRAVLGVLGGPVEMDTPAEKVG